MSESTIDKTDSKDVRWKQRFENYKKALAALKEGVELKKERNLSNLERSGLIQSFEFTQELSWKVLKDYLEYQGFVGIVGSRDAYRNAFNRGLISDGEKWLNLIKLRNLSSHAYDESEAATLETEISGTIINLFSALEATLNALI